VPELTIRTIATDGTHSQTSSAISVSASVGGVIKPAGFENAQGILSAAYAKDGADPQWDSDPGMKKFLDFLAKYYPDGNKLDGSVVYGYGAAQTMVKVLQMCGDDLTRANIMKQAASELLLIALRQVLSGGKYLSESLAGSLGRGEGASGAGVGADRRGAVDGRRGVRVIAPSGGVRVTGERVAHEDDVVARFQQFKRHCGLVHIFGSQAKVQPRQEVAQGRFGVRLRVREKVEPGLLRARVPPLTLQPLVENAIRHGIAKSAAPGHVHIPAARHNGSIKIEIADNGAGVADDTAQEHEGFGLRNTRARLRQLYGDHQNLHLENAPGGGCRVSLTIPLPHPAAVA